MVELSGLIQLIQTVGVGAFIAVMVALIWFYMTRSGYVSSSADANQQTTITKMALATYERNVRLEDTRIREQRQSMRLLMRLQRLEAELARLPKLEADMSRLRKELKETQRERDEAVEQLTLERLENAKLVGRIEALEKHIDKLESQIRRLQRYETEKLDVLDDSGIDVRHVHDDIMGAGGDGGTGGDSGDDGTADGGGDGDGDYTG
jgi:hypothetical protein